MKVVTCRHSASGIVAPARSGIVVPQQLRHLRDEPTELSLGGLRALAKDQRRALMHQA